MSRVYLNALRWNTVKAPHKRCTSLSRYILSQSSLHIAKCNDLLSTEMRKISHELWFKSRRLSQSECHNK